jgi:5-methylcytosine-specific restriction endonuclease McrA
MSTRPGVARGGQQRRLRLRAVVDRDGARCGRCQEAIDLSLSGLHPDGLTLGHIIAAARGGSDAFDNLRPEHRRCNLAASDRVDAPIARLAQPFAIE